MVVFLLLLEVLLVSLMVWESFTRLLAFIPEKFLQRLHAIVRVYLFIPLALLLALFALVLLVWEQEPFAHFAHAVLVLGLWMPTTMLAFSFALLVRYRYRRIGLSLTGLVLSVIPIIVFTPLSRFYSIFDESGFVLPLLIGLACLGYIYVVLLWLTVDSSSLYEE